MSKTSKFHSTDSNLGNALNLINRHERFMEQNTGLTVDPHNDHFIQNTDYVLSNNRHFIADTMAEYQPNGDGTTEGQALHIIGYCHVYMATGNKVYLTAAINAFNAYIDHFYAGQPIPDTPQRYICNWLVNSKEPCLASYPVNPTDATEGGFKCVPVRFVNGLGQIPHGYPFWGEYLDCATMAHRGHMTWDSINATAQKIQENVDGLINWDEIPNYLITNPTEHWSSLAWIDWPRYLGVPSYTVQWGGASSKETTYGVSWLNVWTHNKIGMGKGPNDQLWDGDIIETDIPYADIGKIQLEDETINGIYLVNYASRVPVDKGGYMFARNEPWHNRPVHAPFLQAQATPASFNQLGNAADAELWFIDSCYLLWRITGEERYKKALDCCFFTAHEYTFIDSVDKFFRQGKNLSTPFTDGISYDFSYPELTKIIYERDDNGYIVVKADQSSQHFMEQQSVWFRIDFGSKLRATYGGVGASGVPLGCKVMLDVSPTKEEVDNPTWFGLALPKSYDASPKVVDIPVTSLALMTNPSNNEDYMVADQRAVTDYNGCVWSEEFQQGVYDGRSATVIRAEFPTDSAGFIIGFWLTNLGLAQPKSIVYKAESDFIVRITDDNGWRWFWDLPTSGWALGNLDKSIAQLSEYQPNHEGEPAPAGPVYTNIEQVEVLLKNAGSGVFTYYVVNDVPPLFNIPNGWTMTYRMSLFCTEPWTGLVGDCTILDYRLDSLAYCPGVVPFSNIYEFGTEQIGAWHGMPYPGYQYPFMYVIHKDKEKYAWWLENQIAFLYDSQVAYGQQIPEFGPGCAAYIWNRWDNYKYGPPDTWTTYHWGDGKPWAGYQPRAYNAAARAAYELYIRGEPIPQKLHDYVYNWAVWLVDFAKRNDKHTPNDFSVQPNIATLTPDDFTGHMCGLWLAGTCYALLCGIRTDGLEELAEYAVNELSEGFTMLDIVNKPINGCWSPAARASNDNGMYFGFYTGEIYRGLGMYVMYKKHGVGYNIYENCAIVDHTEASLD